MKNTTDQLKTTNKSQATNTAKMNKQMTTTNNIVSAQIIALKQRQVVLKAENGEYIIVDKPQKMADDKLWYQTMSDILRSGLWVPVNKKLKQMLQYDWFDAQTMQAF